MSRITWAAVLVLCGCIDVMDERGYYGSPCASFTSLVRCDRESGGADPAVDPGPGGDSQPVVVSCDSVCQQLADCGLFDPGQVAECAGECTAEAWPVDCVYAAGCNLDSAEACFGVDQQP